VGDLVFYGLVVQSDARSFTPQNCLRMPLRRISIQRININKPTSVHDGSQMLTAGKRPILRPTLGTKARQISPAPARLPPTPYAGRKRAAHPPVSGPFPLPRSSSSNGVARCRFLLDAGAFPRPPVAVDLPLVDKLSRVSECPNCRRALVSVHGLCLCISGADKHKR